MMSNKPSGGVTPKLDKWPMSKLVWSRKNYFTAITDPILSEFSWFCFPVAWISKTQKKTQQSNKLPYAAYEQRDVMSNACSSNWRSMSLYFIAARACTCTQIHRDLPVTSHCITVMVFQSRCRIHSIFMFFPHFCFFLFPRLVGVSESLDVIGLFPVASLTHSLPGSKRKRSDIFWPTFANE